MKIEQGEKFQPIVITLENKDEAAALWHIVNRNDYEYNEKYNKEYGLKGNFINNFEWSLYRAINPLIGDYASKLKGRFNEQPV